MTFLKGFKDRKALTLVAAKQQRSIIKYAMSNCSQITELVKDLVTTSMGRLSHRGVAYKYPGSELPL